MEIRKQLITSSGKVFGWANPADYITVHETANRSVGANAAAHANLQSRNNVRNASWHWQVDDDEAVQSFTHAAQCFHAGDGRGPGNLRSIGIEICVNKDGNLEQAYINAARLVEKIMLQERIPLSHVVQHNRWSGKNCPTMLRADSGGTSWAEFISLVRGDPEPPVVVDKPIPPKKPVTPPRKDTVMSRLPTLDWRKQDTSYDAFDERVQALLKAADCYEGKLDGRRGPQSIAGLRKFQARYNCGNGRGGADQIIGAKNWESLLFWKKWPR